MSGWYAATCIALVVHQIDAAYWHEWEMFRVPGGIQGFLVFNAVAVGLLIFGFRALIRGTRLGVPSAMFCAALGILTGVLHAGFAVAGYDEFHLPLSLVAIIACVITGAGLAGVLLQERALRSAPRSPHPAAL